MKRADLGRVDSAWTVTVDADARLEQVAEALCSLADGRFGTRGAREEDGTGSTPLVLVAGVYHDDAGGGPTLLPGPVWTGLEAAAPDGQDRRELDLHGGVLRRAWTTADGAALHSLRFVSLARPGVVGLRAEGPPGVLGAGPALLAPGNGPASRRAATAISSGLAPGPPAGAASPPPASAAATTGPGWSAWPSTLATRTTPRRPRRPWSSWVRWRRSGSIGCWPSTAPPGRPGGPTPRSRSGATPTPSGPSGSPCSTCWRRPPRGRRPSGPAG